MLKHASVHCDCNHLAATSLTMEQKLQNSNIESQALPVEPPQNAPEDGKGQSIGGRVRSLIAPKLNQNASTQDAEEDVTDEKNSSEAGKSAQPQTQALPPLFSEVTPVHFEDLAADQFTKPLLIDLNGKNVDALDAWKMDKQTQSGITKCAKSQEEFKAARKLRQIIKDTSARQKTAMFLSAFHAAANDSLVDTSSVSASWDNTATSLTMLSVPPRGYGPAERSVHSCRCGAVIWSEECTRSVPYRRSGAVIWSED